MPPKTAEEMRLARLLSRQSFVKNKAAIKGEVNERLLQKALGAVEAAGEGDGDVSATDLQIIERRLDAAELRREIEGKSSTSNTANNNNASNEGPSIVIDDTDLYSTTVPEPSTSTVGANANATSAVDADAPDAAATTGNSVSETTNKANDKIGSKAAQLAAQRCSLPAYQCREEFLRMVRDHQVVIVEGETGSGKTTQLLQYLLEEEHTISGLSDPIEYPPASTTSTTTKKNTHPQAPRKRRLVCTQPRRLAATSVAERVAEEVGCVLGSTVGYRVRFDEKLSDVTRILFMTDGMMLKEIVTDPELAAVGVIMVDEAHERSTATDVLIGLLRDKVRAVPKEKLRVVLASATIQVDKFCQFFGGGGDTSIGVLSANGRGTTVASTSASSSSSRRGTFIPRLHIKGRTFPVDIHYAADPVPDYVLSAAETAMMLHLTKPLPGDILVFLPGQDDIERCRAMINEFLAEMGASVRQVLLTPVYAALQPEEQRLIQRPTPPGARKVVLATNIAETSITVDGVVYVVDCGLVKQSYFTPGSMVEELALVPISQASASQRCGRAGRTQPGECFRLFTNFMFQNEMEKETEPEILRANLCGVVLQLKAIGIHDLMGFDFIDRPPPQRLAKALATLIELGAVSPTTGQLTDIGLKMAEFPLDPSISRCLVAAPRYHVANEMAAVAAMLSLEGSVFVQPTGRRGGNSNGGGGQQALTVDEHRKAIKASRDRLYAGATSDFCGYLMVFKQWMANHCADRWCREHHVSQRSLLRARDIYNQILATYDRVGIRWRANRNPTDDDPSSVSKDDEPQYGALGSGGDTSLVTLTGPQLDEALTRCLCQGFFAQSAYLDPLDRKSYFLCANSHMCKQTGATASGAAVSPTSSFGAGTITNLHPSSCLALDAEEQRQLREQERSATSAAAIMANGDSGVKAPPRLVIFAGLRITSAEHPYMVHAATVRSATWLTTAAPRHFFDEDRLHKVLAGPPTAASSTHQHTSMF